MGSWPISPSVWPAQLSSWLMRLRGASALRRSSDLAAKREAGRLAGLGVGEGGAAIFRSIAGRSSRAAAASFY
ncbi:MAG: hypothetical protein NTZ40_07240 [Cyanobacteria bacterium]|nr:hypothetical protein [Cyanobacteriota bacterium]